ncbi:MAG: site-specific integrase [Actinomycetota bacterium]|nr:site-specific integrase [Actinomycetota bacterium]
MDFLSTSELRMFLENVKIKDPEYYPLFLTAALTGMRRGELLALKWSDINWATNQIHVRRSLVLGKLQEPKSKAAIRAIIVPPILYPS